MYLYSKRARKRCILILSSMVPGFKNVLKRHLKAADIDEETWEKRPKSDLYGGRRSLMPMYLLKEGHRKNTSKDGGKDTYLIQLKQPSSNPMGSG